MTVVRRELPLSRSASHPWRGLGRRIAQARALRSCPHRRAVVPLQETHNVMSASGRLARHRLGHCRPHETSQFASHGRDGDCGSLAVTDEMTVTTMQALLCAPCLCDDGWRLVRGMTREPVAKARTMSIVPSRLDEDAARMGVTRLGERAAPVPFPRGVFARHQPEIGLQRPRPTKALKVDDLSD